MVTKGYRKGVYVRVTEGTWIREAIPATDDPSISQGARLLEICDPERSEEPAFFKRLPPSTSILRGYPLLARKTIEFHSFSVILVLRAYLKADSQVRLLHCAVHPIIVRFVCARLF